jgi:hypothetical protein
LRVTPIKPVNPGFNTGRKTLNQGGKTFAAGIRAINFVVRKKEIILSEVVEINERWIYTLFTHQAIEMPANLSTIPPSIAILLVGYFCLTLDRQQRELLDESVCENDANMELFEHCLETSLLPIQFDPDRAEELSGIAMMNLN